MDATQATNLTFSGWNAQQRESRIEEQEKLFHYYIGEHSKIISYLEKALEVTFNSDDVAEFQKNYLNITKKVIKSLSVIYSEPAKRYFKSEFGSKSKPKTDYYNSILPININSKDKTINRYGKLFNTALTQVDFDRQTGKITYVNHSSHLYDVIVDESDIYKPIQVSYFTYVTLKGKLELVKVVWTDEVHYYEDSSGRKHPVGDNKDLRNIYGVLPFAIYREEEQGDFWGNGQTDLVNGNEQINFLMTDLINGGVIMQAWGTPVAINMGLSKKTTEGNVKFRSVRLGPKHPIIKDGVTSQEQTPSFKYESASPHINEVMKVIDWQFRHLALVKGLDPNKIIGELTDASGFAKIVDSIEQMELRKDSIEPCQSYEQQRFNITKIINNYHVDKDTGRKFKLQRIPDEEFAVDFAEIKMPVDPETQIIEDNFNLTRNIISVRDIVRRRNPDLSDDEADKLLKSNKEINDKYAPPDPVLNNTNNINLKNNGKELTKEKV